MTYEKALITQSQGREIPDLDESKGNKCLQRHYASASRL